MFLSPRFLSCRTRFSALSTLPVWPARVCVLSTADFIREIGFFSPGLSPFSSPIPFLFARFRSRTRRYRARRPDTRTERCTFNNYYSCLRRSRFPTTVSVSRQRQSKHQLNYSVFRLTSWSGNSFYLVLGRTET